MEEIKFPPIRRGSKTVKIHPEMVTDDKEDDPIEPHTPPVKRMDIEDYESPFKKLEKKVSSPAFSKSPAISKAE